MNSTSVSAFRDELIKIALFAEARKGLTNALKEGWHGTKESPNTWFGQGRQITPGMSSWARRAEEATSLGGATKALPVGAKSMTLLATGLAARDALRSTDPTGRDRSRVERIGGLAGSTMGGLIGSAIGNRIRPGIIGNLVGGTLGSIAGEKIVTAPMKMLHRRRPQPQLQEQVVQPDQYNGVSV